MYKMTFNDYEMLIVKHDFPAFDVIEHTEFSCECKPIYSENIRYVDTTMHLSTFERNTPGFNILEQKWIHVWMGQGMVKSTGFLGMSESKLEEPGRREVTRHLSVTQNILDK